MSSAVRPSALRLASPGPAPARRPRVRPDPPGGRVGVLISGWPAYIHCWTAEEWAALRDRPADARPAANGCWLALRVA